MKKNTKVFTTVAIVMVSALSLGCIVYASDSTAYPQYIGEVKAKQNALKHAGLKESDVRFVTAKLDKDSKNKEYDVEFYSGNKEYDYEIDAISGNVLSSDEDIENKEYTDKKATTSTSTNSSKYIGEVKAKQNALKHAGLKESDVRFVTVKLDKDSKRVEYDVEFYSGNKEYDYEIDAISGKVLSSDFDIENKENTNNKPTNPSKYIGEMKAKQNALKHAGLKESDVRFVTVKLDKDSKRVEYDVEFYSGNKEYDYEIDAISGKVLASDFDIENEENTNNKPSNPSTNKYITATSAKNKAFAHANINGAKAVGLSCEFDYENGKAIYEIDFQVGNVEYEYDIDAKSGAILYSNSEIDD